MAEVTPTGVSQTGMAETVMGLQDAFRSVFGPQIEFDPASVQQQEVGILSQQFAEIDEAIVAVNNGQSLENAQGYQLDFIGSTLGIFRLGATPTTVTLTLGGVAGTVIPLRSIAQTANRVEFETTTLVAIGDAGTVNVPARATILGAIPVGAATITQVVSVVSGWESVNNINAGVTGRDRESDTDFRSRIRRQVQRNSLSSAEAIRIAIEEVSGVTKARVLENPTGAAATVDGVSLVAQSVYALAQGGADNDIAEAIYNTKAGGTVTDGTTTIQLSRGNWNVPIKFARPTAVRITASLTITILPGFPSNGITQISQALLDLVSGLDIGEPLYDGPIYLAILAIPNFRLSGNITVERSGGGAVNAVDGNELLTLAANDVTVATA